MATPRPIASTANAEQPQRERRPWLRLEARDPSPLTDAATFWRASAQAATILMAVLALGVFLYFASKLVVPILAAIAVGMTFGPLIGYATKRGIPAWVVAVAVSAGADRRHERRRGHAGATDRRNARPGAGARRRRQGKGATARSSARGALRIAVHARPDPSGGVEVSNSRVIEGMVTVVTPAAVQFAMQIVLFFGTLFFFIIGRDEFRKYLLNWFASREGRLRALKILNDIEDNLGGYLIVVTAINLSLGVVTTIMAYALGLPAPLLWGALAFGLNYIPYVGPAIMYVLLFVIGILTYPTLLGALLPPGVFMLITLIEGQFLTPAIVGRQVLSIHPLSIFLGIAFWAWLWGPMGAFLATPILIAGRVVYDHVYPQHKSELPG